MKTIHVVAALILDKGNLFATQRGYGDFKDGWEFPGGKIQEGETPEEALVREIKEELDIVIKINSYFTTINYDYPNFHLNMKCYWCSILEGSPTLLEAEDSKWLTLETIDSVNWLPADQTIIEEIKKIL
ncbi:MAG: (deoxy)nucleoside triphosphate pyrophosphohydrolase [Solobacterium sp.]|nr:(deoxy)nucleoside triphosphate pyrophosphohydrolase [Solobacterium sp.]